MSDKSIFVFKTLHVIAWIIFVGLCIEAGALIVNFTVSLFKHEFLQNLYQKLNLYEMYNRSKLAFFVMYGFILSVSVLKAYLFYIVIRLSSNFNLSKPFNNFVAKQITRISYYTLSIGILSFAARQLSINLEKHGFEIDRLNQFWADSQAFILMAAVIYVIAAIITKGVEIQNENDLTV